jgi:hypothetical protein
MSDSRLAFAHFSVPEKGVVFGNPHETGNGYASRLENFRVSQRFAVSRSGSKLIYDNPGDFPVDLFHIPFPDDTTETIRASIAKLYRADGDTQAWVEIPPGGAATAFTGNEKDRFWAAIAPFANSDKGRIVISNGINPIRLWEGGTNSFVDYPGAPPARYGIIQNDFTLLVGDTVESGDRQRQRIRWTVPALPAGDATDWTSLGAGALDLKQLPYPVTGFFTMAGQTYVCASRGIYALLPTSEPINPYAVQVLSRGEGLFFPNSLVAFSSVVAMMTHNSISDWNGTSFEAIDGPVNREWKKRINWNAYRQVTSILDALHRRIGWGLPLDGADFPTEIWWYTPESGRWEIDKRKHTAMTFFQIATPITTIDELVGTIDNLSGTIDDLSPKPDLSPLLMYAISNGETRTFDDAIFDDAGESITAKFESGVIQVLGAEYIAIDGQKKVILPTDHLIAEGVQVHFLDRGESYNIAVDVSGDGGASWSAFGTASVAAFGTSTATDARIVSVTIRGRVSVRDSIQVRLTNLSTGIPWGFAGGYVYVDAVGQKVA